MFKGNRLESVIGLGWFFGKMKRKAATKFRTVSKKFFLFLQEGD